MSGSEYLGVIGGPSEDTTKKNGVFLSFSAIEKLKEDGAVALIERAFYAKERNLTEKWQAAGRALALRDFLRVLGCDDDFCSKEAIELAARSRYGERALNGIRDLGIAKVLGLED